MLPTYCVVTRSVSASQHACCHCCCCRCFGPHTKPTMDEDTIPDHIDPQHTHAPRQLLQMCQELSDISMFDAFGKRPFPWQRAIITHLNLMTCPASGIPPSPAFLCAPTGGGKSMARDSFSAGQGFVLHGLQRELFSPFVDLLANKM